MSALGMARAALGWLDRVLDDPPRGEGGLTLALQGAAAAAICADWAAATRPQASAVTLRALEIAEYRLQSGEGSVLGQSGLLLLTAAVVETAVRGRCRPTLAAYAGDAASALAGTGAPEGTGLEGARRLLVRLGLLPDVPPPGRGLSEIDPGDLLTRPGALAGALDAIEIATGFGLVPAEAPRPLVRVVEVLLLARLQDYRLDAAARLLRLLVYLGAEEARGTALGRRFFPLHQEESGAFGFFEREARALSEASPDPAAPLLFRMGVTLSCLWALAEGTGTGYRLFRDLGRGLAAPAEAVSDADPCTFEEARQ